MTQCTTPRIDCKRLGRRTVVADFSGGEIASDAGALLLEQADQGTCLTARFAACFTDHRDPDLIEHPVAALVRQRVYALALGYEDLNDHDALRRDPLLATVVGKTDPEGHDRVRERDQGRALAGKSTLNRLELTPAGATATARYKKVELDFDAAERVFVQAFLDSRDEPPAELVLDVDATDDPLHGRQEGRFFHGYYRHYCYLPLYVFCGDELLVAQLRPANLDASAGTEDVLAWLVPMLRQRWPHVRIIVRGDSGFARDAILAWCEAHGVHYVFGLARNARLTAALADDLATAQAQCNATGEAARRFKDFRYRTLKSWSCERRVVGKAEHLPGGANPRFVVTSLPADGWDARALYEDLYCARGEMENRIKEQQLYLFADRTSAATVRANQIRLWFSALAYSLIQTVRRVGLTGTRLARARCDTIRLKLLKIGAAIRVTARRVWVPSFS
ncbi:IS1380 family transposase [Planctomycetota bacterium]